MRGERFQVRELEFLRNNPVAYAGRLGFGVYVDRDYAPLEQRLRAYTTYIGEVPRMLAQMRDNLAPPLPAPYVETAHGMFAGLADYLENTVPGLFGGVEDEALQRLFECSERRRDRSGEGNRDLAGRPKGHGRPRTTRSAPSASSPC